MDWLYLHHWVLQHPRLGGVEELSDEDKADLRRQGKAILCGENINHDEKECLRRTLNDLPSDLQTDVLKDLHQGGPCGLQACKTKSIMTEDPGRWYLIRRPED